MARAERTIAGADPLNTSIPTSPVRDDESRPPHLAAHHTASPVPPQPHQPPGPDGYGYGCGVGAACAGPAPAWIAGLAALLVGEVLLLTYRFDAQAIVDGGGWWAPLVGWARYVPQVALAAAAAALVIVLAGPRGRPVACATNPARGPASARRGAAYLALHLGLYGLLVLLTHALWEGAAGRSPQAPAWFALWGLTGLGVAASWALAAQPARAWLALGRRGLSSGVLLAALAAGAGACLVGQLTGTLWGALGGATLRAVHLLLGLVFRDVVYLPAEAVVGTATFHVEVAASCSGYEGIGLIWAFLAVYLAFFRRELRFPQALWLVPLGTVVMWLANVGRITALIVVGSTLSPEVALGGFHSQAGWLAFNAVALGLVVLSRRLPMFAVARGDEAPAPPAIAAGPTPIGPAVAQLGPLLALVATVMITGAFSPPSALDRLYPARVVAVVAALFALRRAYGPIAWRSAWSWPAVLIGVVAFGVWLALEPAPASAPSPAPDPAAVLLQWPRWVAAGWLALRIVGSVVTVPIAEELAFRGYLIRRLAARDVESVAPATFTWASFLGSSLLFGLLHGRWLAGTLAGMLYAVALRRRGRLSDAIIAHGTTNALIAADVLATGAWSLWA